MDFKFWASFSAICIVFQCCQLTESKLARGKCMGLLKDPRCPNSNISFTKRLLDEIMKRADTGTAGTENHSDSLRREDELNAEEEKDATAPSDDWNMRGAVEKLQPELEARAKAEEELRRKEIELLFVRALLDDLEADTPNRM